MDKLQLGYIVHQEQKEEARRHANSPHKTQSKDYQKRKRNLVNKYSNNGKQPV